MKTKKSLKIAGNVFVWVVFALALFTLIMTFSPSGGMPNFFGLGYLSVQSDSMEPKINEGDLIKTYLNYIKKRVLITLQKSKIYRTDIDGLIKIILNKKGYKIKSCNP